MASEQSNKMSGLSFPVRIGLAALGLLVLFGLYSINRDRLSLEHLAERQEQIGALLKQYPVLLFAAGYLLYTAVTRARELFVLVGSKRALQRAIGNDEQANRFTSLAQRLSL